MKINEIIEYQIVDFLSLNEETSTERKRTNTMLADGRVWTSKHYDQREKERLEGGKAHSRQDFAAMMTKFIRDPISKNLKNIEPNSADSNFCIYNHNNLGVAISKTELPVGPAGDKFEIAYLITTLSGKLFPYSNQNLYMVPKNGPCRKFTEEDFKIFTPQQMRAFTPQGRLGR